MSAEQKWLPLNPFLKEIIGTRLRTVDLVSRVLEEHSFAVRIRRRVIIRKGISYQVASHTFLRDEKDRLEEFIHSHPDILISRTWPG